MPLSEDAFPYVDETGKTKVWDNGQSYDLDQSGQVMTPGGVEIPWWGSPTQAQPQATPTAQPQSQGFTPYSPQVPSLPGLDIQPGMGAQQWEATYTLALAQEKRLRELLETVTQPQARAAIDQAIQALRQANYGSQVQARESQAAMTGKIPQWLPQPPQFTPGAYRQYEQPRVTGPGGQADGGQTYDTVNGPKTVAQMEQELRAANWPGNEDVPTAYARTTGGPVTPRRG